MISRSNKVFLASLLLFNGFFLCADEDKKPIQSVLKEKFHATKNWACEVAFADFLGYESLSPENEAFVREILIELGATQEIAIRRLSKTGIRLFGYQNAFFLMNYLFISEDWFNTLSIEEKRALIAHESIHAKERHDLQSLALYYILVSGAKSSYFNACQNEIQKLASKQKVVPVHLVQNGFSLLLFTVPFLFFKRYIEKRADVESVKALNNAKDLATLMKRWQNEIQDPESKFFLRRLGAWLDKYIGYYFTKDHPLIEEREAYLNNIALEQSAT